MSEVKLSCANCKHCREVTITKYCTVWGYLCRIARNDSNKCGDEAKNWEKKRRLPKTQSAISLAAFLLIAFSAIYVAISLGNSK